MAASFNNYGVKRVSKTDAGKKAYVPNTSQDAAIQAAGIIPATARPADEFKIAVLNDSSKKWVGASYYHSMRMGSNRSGEPRMGHEIASWLMIGDYVLIGNVGPCLFVQKLTSSTLAKGRSRTPAASAAVLAKAAADAVADILARASKAKGKPSKHKVQRTEFVRNPNVAAAALIRANGKCEMPGCNCRLFLKENGQPYLEAHHITPLSENGDDTLANAAALCPHHHRVLHFGKGRRTLRQKLRRHVASISP